jgi:sugar phosphate isomerase/epimerase
MKIGFLVNPYSSRPLGEVLELLRDRHQPALKAIEVGMSPYSSLAHGDPQKLSASREAREDWEQTIVRFGFQLSSISAHGNPLHPRRSFAKLSQERFRSSVELMGKLEACLFRDARKRPVRVVNAFSGLPGEVVIPGKKGRQAGSLPIWNCAPWPDEHYDSYRLQVKFAGGVWRELLKVARDNGVQVGFELHPNMLAHNAETYLELIEAAGDDGSTLGLNFDPSHFFWRGIDPLAMLRYLRGQVKACAVKHVHGKDAFTDRFNTEVNGCLSMIPYSDEARRPWRFVTIGEGWDPVNGSHDLNWWQRFITELQLGGYDHVISIEHEDSRKSFEEGIGKALEVLDKAVNRESPGEITWAKR